MPGRLLSSLVRPSTSSFYTSSSCSTSYNDLSNKSSNSSRSSSYSSEMQRRDSSPDGILSAAVDHIIHPHKEHREKLLSLGRVSRSRERHQNARSKAASSSRAPAEIAPPAAKLDVIVESPPLICYGIPANSSGALFSGRLSIAVADFANELVLDSFSMRLLSKTTTKRPVSKDCPDCTVHTEELNHWNFLTEPLHLVSGDHQFPFSYLFPGNLPASANGQLGSIEYLLVATAVSTAGETFDFRMPLNVRRAILPGNDKASIRIFPPTNLTGRVVLPSVVHPIGTFPVQMALSGVVDIGPETQTRWRLRKMMWRIEEHQKVVSIPCSKHAHKVGGENKGILHQETRVIGHKEEKNGWKTDFDTAGGEIDMEFDATINPTCNPVCDLESLNGNGLEVKHNLVIELVVAEELCPNRNTRLITPTGAARVLRMQFNLLVTERSGLGISWDEEMPPVYEDVPASPPGYSVLDGNCAMEDYIGSPLPPPSAEELDTIDHLRLDSNDLQHSSTHSSSSRAGPSSSSQQQQQQQRRGRSLFTVDDLTAAPEHSEFGRSNRAASVSSQRSS